MRNLTLAALAAITLLVPAAAGAQPGTEPSGSLVFESNGYKHITTSDTFLSSSFTNPRLLSSVCVNTAQTGATITVYDNTAATGATIAVIDASATGCFYYDIALTTGLTVVTAGMTPGDYTVVYR